MTKEIKEYELPTCPECGSPDIEGFDEIKCNDCEQEFPCDIDLPLIKFVKLSDLKLAFKKTETKILRLIREVFECGTRSDTLSKGTQEWYKMKLNKIIKEMGA